MGYQRGHIEIRVIFISIKFRLISSYTHFRQSVREEDLIERIRADDPRAFKELFDSNVTLVHNVCFRMLGSRQDAEDVTQEVFLEAYKSLHRFRFESKLSTWLYRIAVNRSLNHQRKRKLERWLSLDFEVGEGGAEGSAFADTAVNEPDSLLEKEDTERIVQNAIGKLSERQRIALLLHRYENLPYQEIAKIMGVSVASVESLLHRAKETLAKRLLPLRKHI
jgi:RNA polymerase sigma-70 factor (ECF subfamily)